LSRITLKAGARRDLQDAHGHTALYLVETELRSLGREFEIVGKIEIRNKAQRLSDMETRKRRLEDVRQILQ
jgi:hypothetical protein